jgi:hypothetical protein
MSHAEHRPQIVPQLASRAAFDERGTFWLSNFRVMENIEATGADVGETTTSAPSGEVG